MNTKILRQKILDLAIRGKLTEQKESDGTTKDLLASIAASSACHAELVSASPSSSAKKNSKATERSVILERTSNVILERTSNVIASEAKQSKKSKPAEPKTIIPLNKDEAPFEIPETWEWVRLGDISHVTTGKTPLKAEKKFYCNGIIPWITSASTKNEYIADCDVFITEYAVEKNTLKIYSPKTLILAMYGEGKTRGQISELNISATINQACAAIELSFEDDFHRKYIKYFHNWNYERIREGATGSTQPNLNLSIVQSTLIPLPPLAEQKRIVEAIESAFAEITEIENNQELLKKHIKQGHQKILDLAIRGKLTEQKESDGTTKDLLTQIQDERRETNDESDAGKKGSSNVILERTSNVIASEAKQSKKSKPAEPKTIIPLDKNEAPFEIPETWEWVRLGDVCGIVSGGTPKTEIIEFWENGTIPWLSPADLTGYKDMYISEGAKKITPEGLQHSSAVMMPERSVLYSSRAPIGYVAIAKNALCTNQGFKSLLPSVALISEFAYYLLKARTEDIKLRASGTTFKEISGSELGRTLIPLPPLAEQQRIVAAIESAFTEFDAMEKL